MPADSVHAIRAAFSAGEFAKAERLFGEYTAEMAGALRGGTARPAMLSEARDLIDWARLVAAGFRAHALDRLKEARLAEAYLAAPGRSRPSIRVSL
jgi:hypothetical protein